LLKYLSENLPSFSEKVILGDEGKKKVFKNEKLIS
jgi:hypothetical protein